MFTFFFYFFKKLQADYLDNIVDIFRERRMKAKKKKGKGKGKKKKGSASGGAKGAGGEESKEPAGPVTRGVIYMQTTYPVWRQKLLTFLDGKWNVELNGFAVEKKGNV